MPTKLSEDISCVCVLLTDINKVITLLLALVWSPPTPELLICLILNVVVMLPNVLKSASCWKPGQQHVRLNQHPTFQNEKLAEATMLHRTGDDNYSLFFTFMLSMFRWRSLSIKKATL